MSIALGGLQDSADSSADVQDRMFVPHWGLSNLRKGALSQQPEFYVPSEELSPLFCLNSLYKWSNVVTKDLSEDLIINSNSTIEQTTTAWPPPTTTTNPSVLPERVKNCSPQSFLSKTLRANCSLQSRIPVQSIRERRPVQYDMEEDQEDENVAQEEFYSAPCKLVLLSQFSITSLELRL